MQSAVKDAEAEVKTPAVDAAQAKDGAGVSEGARGQAGALARIPVDEATGEPNFEAVGRDVAWDGLVEAAGGDAAAAEIAQAQIDQASAVVEALERKAPVKKSPKLRGTPMEMAKQKREADEEYNAEMEAYNAELDAARSRQAAWRGILAEYAERQAAESPSSVEQAAQGAEPAERGGGTSIQNNISEKKEVTQIDPRTMPDEEKARRGDMLRNAEAIPVEKNMIVSDGELSARKVAEAWWDANVGAPVFYETEAGEVEIAKSSIKDSLSHGYNQAKLDALTSLSEGFRNATYLGSLPDFERPGVLNHYFAYPIFYDGQRRYVFCRAMDTNNKNKLYVHEVFLEEAINKSNTLQTIASASKDGELHGGIALYRAILKNVLDGLNTVEPNPSDGKDNTLLNGKQGNGEKSLAEAPADAEDKPVQGLEGRTRAQIKDMVREHVAGIAEDMGAGLDVKGIEIHGSRERGDAREDSDLDVVVEYSGDMKEDAMFNALNEEPLMIDGIRVDINPIRKEETGTLAKYMEKSRAYDEEKRRGAERARAEAQKQDNQGNPIDDNGNLIVDEVKSIADITDSDFTIPSRTIGLPTLPDNINEAIGSKGRKVIIKKSIFKKNRDTHRELNPSDSRGILQSALYNPTLVSTNQPISRPDYKVVIHTGDKNAIVVLDVYDGKANVEIVGWRKIDAKGLEKMKRQAEREGGQFLILSPNEGSAAALSALPSAVSFVGKGTTKPAEKQEGGDVFSENSELGALRDKLLSEKGNGVTMFEAVETTEGEHGVRIGSKQNSVIYWFADFVGERGKAELAEAEKQLREYETKHDENVRLSKVTSASDFWEYLKSIGEADAERGLSGYDIKEFVSQAKQALKNERNLRDVEIPLIKILAKEITPEQKSLLDGNNLRQYPTTQELSIDKGNTLSTDKQGNGDKNFKERLNADAFDRRADAEALSVVVSDTLKKHGAITEANAKDYAIAFIEFKRVLGSDEVNAEDVEAFLEEAARQSDREGNAPTLQTFVDEVSRLADGRMLVEDYDFAVDYARRHYEEARRETQAKLDSDEGRKILAGMTVDEMDEQLNAYYVMNRYDSDMLLKGQGLRTTNKAGLWRIDNVGQGGGSSAEVRQLARATGEAEVMEEALRAERDRRLLEAANDVARFESEEEADQARMKAYRAAKAEYMANADEYAALVPKRSDEWLESEIKRLQASAVTDEDDYEYNYNYNGEDALVKANVEDAARKAAESRVYLDIVKAEAERRKNEDLFAKAERIAAGPIIPKKVTNVKPINFVAGKKEIDGVFKGVYYAEGKAVASDKHILYECKVGYPAEYEGTIRAKDGTLINGIYPNVQRAFDSFDDAEAIDVDIEAMRRNVARGMEAIKMIKDGLVVVELGRGRKIGYFEAGQLKQFLDAVDSAGSDVKVRLSPNEAVALLYMKGADSRCLLMGRDKRGAGACFSVREEVLMLPKGGIDTKEKNKAVI